MNIDDFKILIVEKITPKVKTLSSVSIAKKYNLIYGREEWDLTVFYTTKKGRKTNVSWMVFANEYRTKKTLWDLLDIVDEQLTEIE